jgi:hypothetical protein
VEQFVGTQARGGGFQPQLAAYPKANGCREIQLCVRTHNNQTAKQQRIESVERMDAVFRSVWRQLSRQCNGESCWVRSNSVSGGVGCRERHPTRGTHEVCHASILGGITAKQQVAFWAKRLGDMRDSLPMNWQLHANRQPLGRHLSL